MDKRKIWIGMAVAAGLLILFFVGHDWVTWQKQKQGREQAQLTLKRTKQTLHQLCRYADSVCGESGYGRSGCKPEN